MPEPWNEKVGLLNVEAVSMAAKLCDNLENQLKLTPESSPEVLKGIKGDFAAARRLLCRLVG